MSTRVRPIDAIIRSHLEAAFKDPGRLHFDFKSDKDRKRLNNALEGHAEHVSPEAVLAMADTTILPTGRLGFVVTRAGFYARINQANAYQVPFARLQSCEIEKPFEPGKAPDPSTFSVVARLDEGVTRFSPATLRSLKLDGSELYRFFEAMIEARKAGLTDEVDSLLIIEDLSDEARLAYVSLLALALHLDDDQLDERELSELFLLMTRLDFDADLRQRAHAFIAEPQGTPEDLLETLNRSIPRGSEQSIHLSLMKDLLQLARVAHDADAVDREPIVQHYSEILDIDDKTIEILVDAIELDEKIYSGALDDDAVAEAAKELAARATSLGLPIAAVYLSGSVVGLSAAGITSGLAGLGLGGVLGLSSMLTGVGVAVLIGVVAYQGIRYLTGAEARDRARRREVMLQEVLRIQQGTINALAEQINRLAQRLVDLVTEQEVDRTLIDKLGREISLLGRAMGEMHGRTDESTELLDVNAG